LQLRHEGGDPFPALDGLEGDPVHAGAPLLGPHPVIGMIEDIRPIHLVVQRVEAIGWLLLGLAVQLPLQCPDALRGC
jgi:hypothetical protein